jgi:hypothetical protein
VHGAAPVEADDKPTQARFLMIVNQSCWVTLAGMPFSPPNSFFSGIVSREYQ